MPLSNFLPDQYSNQLSKKINHLQQLFNNLETPALEIFSSHSHSFRMRAEFRIWHQDDRCFYAMFNKDDKKTPVEINHFPIASKTIQQAMPKLLEEIHADELLKSKIFQVEFLSSTTGELLITLIYHKALHDLWLQKAKHLEEKLNCFIIGRSRKQRIIVSQDFIHEKLNIEQQEFTYQQLENSFTQPNAFINQRMLNWACDAAAKFDNDLLELYCGNGNFTLPLSKHFRKVLATEMAKSGIHSAIYNQEINQIKNITLVRLHAEEVSQALNGEREFRRLKDIQLSEYNFSTIFVDPPRAGIDKKTLAFMKNFENIIYISCNPETLNENLQTLNQDFKIKKFAAFDQFPYSQHLEAGVVLEKR